MKQKIELPDMSKLVGALLKQRGSSLRKQSLKMGYSHGYLINALQRKNLHIGLLLELSNVLDINLLEYYLPHLKEHLRTTAAERELVQKMNDQTAQLLRITEERDRYWKVIEGRAGS